MAEWLSKAPKLRQLTTPSAPNPEFFQVGHEPLRFMRVDAGWDAQGFILNLSRRPTMMIAILDWGEVHDDIEGWEEAATPYEHFEALFSSPACPGDVTLRNPRLSEAELAKLAAIQQRTCMADGGRGSALQVFRTSRGFHAHQRSDMI